MLSPAQFDPATGAQVAQLDPATGTPLAFLGTFLVAAVFYTATLFVAARYVLGDAPLSRAAIVGVTLAAASLLLQRYQPAIVIVTTLALDAFAISAVYRLSWRSTALVAVVHYTVAVIAGITLFNLFALLQTAPA
jgi:hypothetical protein